MLQITEYNPDHPVFIPIFSLNLFTKKGDMALLKILFLVLFLSTSLVGQGIVDSIVWAKQFSNEGLTNLLIEVDNDDNVYVAAGYQGCEQCFVVYQEDTLAVQGDGSKDILLAKIDNDGELISSILLGGSGDDFIAGFKVDSENSLLLYLKTEQAFTFDNSTISGPYTLLKLVGDFNLDWSQDIIGSRHKYHDSPLASLQEQFDVTATNDVVIGGKVPSFYNTDTLTIANTEFYVDTNNVFVAKIKSTGTLEWLKVFEHNGFYNHSQISSIDIQRDGDINVLGYYKDHDLIIGEDTLMVDPSTQYSRRNTFIMKLDEDGAVKWAKKYFGDFTPVDLISDEDGNLIASGYYDASTYFELDTLFANGSADLAVFKVDPSGSYLWGTTLGDQTTNNHCYLASNNDNELFVSGNISSNVGMIMNKLSASGELLWVLDPFMSFNRSGTDLAFDRSGNLFQTCTYTDFFQIGAHNLMPTPGAGGWQSVVMKFSGQSKPDVVNTSASPTPRAIEFNLFPNPASDALHLNYQCDLNGDLGIIVYDINGKSVLETMEPSIDAGLVRLNVAHLQSGTYWVSLISDRFISTKPIVILR